LPSTRALPACSLNSTVWDCEGLRLLPFFIGRCMAEPYGPGPASSTGECAAAEPAPDGGSGGSSGAGVGASGRRRASGGGGTGDSGSGAAGGAAEKPMWRLTDAQRGGRKAVQV
jgi:hypothetical protein